jgi:hypothetical protein
VTSNIIGQVKKGLRVYSFGPLLKRRRRGKTHARYQEYAGLQICEKNKEENPILSRSVSNFIQPCLIPEKLKHLGDYFSKNGNQLKNR